MELLRKIKLMYQFDEAFRFMFWWAVAFVCVIGFFVFSMLRFSDAN